MKVRLGRKMFTVERVEGDEIENAYGECDYSGVIRVRKRQGLEEMIDTLLHEGIHAQEPTWSEEKVKRRSRQLTALLVAGLTS